MPVRMSFAIPPKMLATEGPIGIPVAIAAPVGPAVATGDFGLEQTNGTIGFVQSVYIDNSGNANPFTITFPGTQQSITVKGRTQGYYPIVPFQGTFSWAASTLVAPATVNVIFMNVQFEAAQWATQ